MNWSGNQKWFAIALMGVILPISLLVTFKLTGIIPKPKQPETLQQDPVIWGMERPSFTREIFAEGIESAYADGEIAIQIGLYVATYRENPSPMWAPYLGRDGIAFLTKVNVSSLRGSVSITIKYLMDTNSTLYFNKNSWALIQQNITVTRIENPRTYGREGNITVKTSGSPCYLEVWSDWVFGDPNNENHKLNVALEATYYNGAAYRKIILPIQFHIWVDAGNNFESAKQIDVGNYTAFLGIGTPFPGRDDLEDYYRLWVEEDKNIHVQMTHQTNIDFNLYLYDPNENLLASSCSRPPEVMESIFLTAEASGWYYIRVTVVLGSGMYTLKVTS